MPGGVGAGGEKPPATRLEGICRRVLWRHVSINSAKPIAGSHKKSSHKSDLNRAKSYVASTVKAAIPTIKAIAFRKNTCTPHAMEAAPNTAIATVGINAVRFQRIGN